MEEKLDIILEKLDDMATKQDIEILNKKLDGLSQQVAENTEQKVVLSGIEQQVISHETDIKILKKLLAQ